jgi:hypothetical protein
MSAVKLSVLRLLTVAAAAIAVLCSAPPAFAQLTRVGGSIGVLEPGLTMRGTDTAYDPARDVYLLVVGNGPIYGIFVNGAGIPVTGAFAIMDGSLGWGHFPRARYSRHVFGGTGGFLVTWHHNLGTVNGVFGRTVSIARGVLASPIQQISDGTQGGSWWETGPAMAYSDTSGRFLVAWRTIAYGIQGRFVDSNGTPFGGILPLANPSAGVGHRDPALTWNAATDDFALASTGWNGAGALASFRRVRASDGFVSGQTDFGYSAGTFATAIDVNTWNNQYVLAWSVHPGTKTATFDQNGTYLATSLATGRLGFDQSLGIAFNPASGTFLAVSSDGLSFEVGAVEIRGSGAPNSTVQLVTDGAKLGSFHPMASARVGTNQWDVVYSRDFRGATSQMIATAATGGGQGLPTTLPAPAPTANTGCATSDPFVAIGGGTCFNGGWIPGSASTPAPAPAPTAAPAPAPTTGCTTPDPFVSIGGGTCVSGGWQPGVVSPAPTPTPTATPTSTPAGCSTPDPFVSIGGGTCVGGGWIPGVVAPAPTPAPAPVPSPTPTGCATSDPFVSLGGGMCISGGWWPR